MGATERIAELLKALPEREVAEVLDFAEYLATRCARQGCDKSAAGFLSAVDGLQIDAPADYSKRFAEGLYENRP